MSTPRTLDVSELPAYDISNQSPLFLGQLLMCVIEGSMFSILIATYFYLRLGVDVWPPPGVRPPNPAVATWALLPLVASCAGSHWADKAAKKNDRRGMILGMLVNLLLAGIFLLLRAYEWGTPGFHLGERRAWQYRLGDPVSPHLRRSCRSDHDRGPDPHFGPRKIRGETA